MRVTYRCAGRCRDGAHVYEEVAARFCCGEMERHWGRLVTFGMPGQRSIDRAVNLCSAVPQANGKTILVLVKVDFCPWCGETIETCRVK